MASGTLYTYADNFRAFKALIAAGYSGANVSLGDFKFGETNKSADFLKKFPLGKVPAFEGSDGLCLFESNAIAYHVSNDALRGSNATAAALVQMFVHFSENEVLPSACAWVFPTLGLKQYNKGETEKATTHIKSCLGFLNNHLSTKTFLVGERVTLADITLCCNMIMLYKQVLDPTFRAPYGNVTRWFLTCVNQPEFKKVVGDVKLSEKMAQFDAKKFAALNPKQGKDDKKKEAKKQAAPKAKQEPKPKKKEEEDDEDEAPAPPQVKDPFASLPPTTFVLDQWKRVFSNEDTYLKAIPWFYENIDKEGYSQWFAEYNYNDDIAMVFMASNLVKGFYQRLGKLVKNTFGSVIILGENGNLSISGVFLFRGQELGFNLSPDWCIDSESYSFRKLDYDNEEDQNLFKKYLLAEGFGAPVADTIVFK